MSEANLGESVLKKRNLPEYLRAHFSDTQRYVIIWIITGVACGLAAVAFHLAIDKLFHFVRYMVNSWGGGNPWLTYGLLVLAPTFGGLVTGLILVKAPDAAGSGIPQTKARYFRDFGIFKLREAIARFFIGTLSIGFGMSLGREGPTVHICAAIASKIGQMFGLAKKRIQAMVPLGMGAGIAAAFNTPMAAVFFVFEELIGDFSSKSFFGIFICVVIASVVQRLIIGEHPAFDIELSLISTDWWMLLAVPLGLASGLLGKVFIDGLLRVRQEFRQSKQVPLWLRPAIGGFGVGVVGISVMAFTDGHTGIFGIGYNDLDSALNGRLEFIGVVALLLGGKMIASILAYGSGGSGGLFAPVLFIGGMLGALLGLICQPMFNFQGDVIGALALLGMGSFFAAVIRCPMTSIVIIWEMTGFYSLILPLMVGNMLAWLVSSKLQPVPLYDSLLLQDKISLKKLPSYKGDQDWRNLPVTTVMTFDPISVRGDWSIDENLALIQESGWKHHAYPVVEEHGALIGMITHHEMLEADAEAHRNPVRALVEGRQIISLKPEMSIRDVAQILVLEDVLQAPVVSPKDPTKILGIITLHDIARQQNAIDETIGR